MKVWALTAGVPDEPGHRWEGGRAVRPGMVGQAN